MSVLCPGAIWCDSVTVESLKAQGARVRARRKEKLLTAAQLAESAGVSLNTIVRIERGESEPRNITKRAICEALDWVDYHTGERSDKAPAADPVSDDVRMARIEQRLDYVTTKLDRILETLSTLGNNP